MEIYYHKKEGRLWDILRFVLWLGCLSATDGQLQCYNCTNIAAIDDCDSTTTCGLYEHCFTEVRGELGNRTFNSGCRTETECLAVKPDPVASIVGKRSTTSSCNQCCGVSLCNNKICAAVNSVTVISNGTCEDDPTFDCERTSGFYNLCGDVAHAKTVCRKFCGLCRVVDGNWSSWTTWSTCSVTCDSGTATRSRTCSNPSPAHGGLDCIGHYSQSQPCHKQQCPIHGGWSKWSTWGMCSVTCGIGLARRDRSCSSPYPGLGGDHCFGESRDDRPCFEQACIDGSWSTWSIWDSCSSSCGPGIMQRIRQCNNPSPSTFGRECQGYAHDVKQCFTFTKCTNGVWSVWSHWESCSATCGSGISKRQKQCNNPPPSSFGRECHGDAHDVKQCSTSKSCYPIDGYWTPWTRWTYYKWYSDYCTRHRTCNGPFLGGVACTGDATQKRSYTNTLC